MHSDNAARAAALHPHVAGPILGRAARAGRACPGSACLEEFSLDGRREKRSTSNPPTSGVGTRDALDWPTPVYAEAMVWRLACWNSELPWITVQRCRSQLANRVLDKRSRPEGPWLRVARSRRPRRRGVAGACASRAQRLLTAEAVAVELRRNRGCGPGAGRIFVGSSRETTRPTTSRPPSRRPPRPGEGPARSPRPPRTRRGTTRATRPRRGRGSGSSNATR
jgi:hypothetical protein